jgi:multiple sugar transport system ATP-binding protein
VFLFDEPLSNLDAKLRVQTRAEITKLHQRLQTTFIYVTHDQVEAMTMATRIAVMRDGILMQIDTPQNLYDHPANVFVAGFIGSPAMNFFNAKLVRADGGMMVKTSSYTVPVPTNQQDKYASHLDKDVIFGIRPDDIHDPDFAPPGIDAAPVDMRVDVTELMGNEIFVFMETGEDQFVGRFDPRTSYSHGGQGKAVFNMTNMHLFDTENLQETLG